MPKPNITTSAIADLYLNKRLTLMQTGETLGMSHTCVARRLNQAGIPRRSQTGRDREARPAVG